MNARAKGAALLVAVFGLGAVAGGGGTYAWMRRDEATAADEDHGGRSPRRLRALERELDLTGAQREQVRAIMEQSGDERRRLAQEMFERCGDGVRAHHDAVSAQIRALLTPEQRARFDVLAQQRDRFPFGGGGRGGRGRGGHGRGGF